MAAIIVVLQNLKEMMGNLSRIKTMKISQMGIVELKKKITCVKLNIL